METGSGNITIKNRELLTMSEVSEVLTFDEDFVAVMTPLGKVEIEGNGMKIVQMSAESGDFTLCGRIDGIFYANKPGAKKGIFSHAGK